MNIEIANRLVQLRKQHGLSQEQLAASLGISRQAVSKWERAESSPDTDNLICLAQLYGISLDELLLTGVQEEQPAPPQEEAWSPPAQEAPGTYGNAYYDPYAQPYENAPNAAYSQQPNDAYQEPNYDAPPAAYPPPDYPPVSTRGTGAWMATFPVLAVIFFLAVGLCFHVWHPTWMIFLVVPLVECLVYSNRRGKSRYDILISFPYPVLAVLLFLFLGFWMNLWHPGWLIFLTIPVYYGVVSSLK